MKVQPDFACYDTGICTFNVEHAITINSCILISSPTNGRNSEEDEKEGYRYFAFNLKENSSRMRLTILFLFLIPI